MAPSAPNHTDNNNQENAKKVSGTLSYHIELSFVYANLINLKQERKVERRRKEYAFVTVYRLLHIFSCLSECDLPSFRPNYFHVIAAPHFPSKFSLFTHINYSACERVVSFWRVENKRQIALQVVPELSFACIFKMDADATRFKCIIRCVSRSATFFFSCWQVAETFSVGRVEHNRRNM